MTADDVLKIATPIAIIVAAVVQQLAVNRARKEVEKIKATAEKSTVKLDTIHTLVNSAMSDQKRIAAVLARRVALLTGSKEDEVIASEAEKIAVLAGAPATTEPNPSGLS